MTASPAAQIALRPYLETELKEFPTRGGDWHPSPYVGHPSIQKAIALQAQRDLEGALSELSNDRWKFISGDIQRLLGSLQCALNPKVLLLGGRAIEEKVFSRRLMDRIIRKTLAECERLPSSLQVSFAELPPNWAAYQTERFATGSLDDPLEDLFGIRTLPQDWVTNPNRQKRGDRGSREPSTPNRIFRLPQIPYSVQIDSTPQPYR
eukprot:TRINITY_DN51571_c0_g1_i3.p2 TRINITY_DN51571_c0_g1~~TRINITY_DN51571_c0_g1_i3.p2  ORF type:complete len:207 (-),score=18.62 TRINITY_DN51571_c0_g1_i3:11-631(-)